jgi:hypothetical protein
MRRADLVQHTAKDRIRRTSQIIFGERQHLLRVLDSIERCPVPGMRLDPERAALEKLIHARTLELNEINPNWDQKIAIVLNSSTPPEMLEQLAQSAPPEDYYLLRLISEHPKASAKTMRRLAGHEYAAIRENVARHPNADAATLTRLCKDRAQPLWYLVAFNPNAPAALRRKLRERMRKLGQSAGTQ